VAALHRRRCAHAPMLRQTGEGVSLSLSPLRLMRTYVSLNTSTFKHTFFFRFVAIFLAKMQLFVGKVLV
jgi:hypothetical protein